MSYDKAMKELYEIKNNPSLVEGISDPVDKLINDIIKVEKKHLYGIETTSESKRQEEIKSLIDKFLLGNEEGKL